LAVTYSVILSSGGPQQESVGEKSSSKTEGSAEYLRRHEKKKPAFLALLHVLQVAHECSAASGKVSATNEAFQAARIKVAVALAQTARAEFRLATVVPSRAEIPPWR